MSAEQVLTYLHPQRNHVVELREGQTVQQDALERIGYHLVQRGSQAAAGPEPLERSIADLEGELQKIDDQEKLMRLYQAEEHGQRRKGALKAISERLSKLTEQEQ